MRKLVHLQPHALAPHPPEYSTSQSPQPHFDDFANPEKSILSYIPLPEISFDLTILSLIVVVLLLSLSAFGFIFHLYEKSRRLHHLQDFNSLWIVRLYLVLLTSLWSVNEISRLPYVRRKYLHTFLPPPNLERETTICKIHNVLSLGFLEPGFLITLLLLINVSIKKRNPRCIWAILTVLTLCIPTLFLQLFFVYFSPLESKLPRFMYISSVITADRLGNKVILCTCPFFSWVIFTGFAIVYAIAFSFSCWRVMAYAINKAIGHRINVLATTVMVALPLQIVCLCLSWMLEHDMYGLVELTMFLAVATCMVVAVVLLVHKPIKDALEAGGDGFRWGSDEGLLRRRKGKKGCSDFGFLIFF